MGEEMEKEGGERRVKREREREGSGEGRKGQEIIKEKGREEREGKEEEGKK